MTRCGAPQACAGFGSLGDWAARVSIDPSEPSREPVEVALDAARGVLERGAARAGVPLDADQLGRFARYLDLLLEWNDRAGLTSLSDASEITSRHFVESLALLAVLRDAGLLAATEQPVRPRVADIGTGGGFPGLPMRIAAPSLDLAFDLVLIESQARRCRFLELVVDALDLARVEVVQSRIEDAGRSPRLREQFDLVVARALAPLSVLVELALPLLRPGGVLATPKGERAHAELEEAGAALEALGGVALPPLALPHEEGAHPQTVVLVRREGDLDARYPRRAGTPQRRPLA